MKTDRLRLGAFVLCLVVGWPVAAGADGGGATCRVAAKSGNAIEMNPTWSGTTVGYSALVRGKKVYFGYYDPKRTIAVSQLDTDSAQICTNTIDSVFNGWDSHNAIVMAFDESGTLHVAGNMHGTPLVYARASKPDSTDGLTLQPMVGRDEERVTYPRFLRDSDGKLLFAYRSGASGKGAWIMNRFDGGAWRRVSDQPMFGGTWRGGRVSAYPSRFETGPDGVEHVAIVWRRTGDVATNFAVSYARTRDFIQWQGADGRDLATPLTPESADLVEWVGENNGLVNSPVVAVGKDNRPFVAYTRYGDDTRNAVIVARFNGSNWKTSAIAEAKERKVVQGKGSGIGLPRLNAIDAETGSVVVRFSGAPAMEQKFDVDTLQRSGNLQRPRRPTSPSDKPVVKIDGLTGLVSRKVPAVDYRTGDRALGAFEFAAQKTNRDRPHACTTEAPLACSPPPSPVYFVPLAQ